MNTKDKIEEWLEKESLTNLELEDTSPFAIVKIWEELGGEVDLDSFETNGWEWDWWYDAGLNGEEYYLSGSGYYGTGSIQIKE